MSKDSVCIGFACPEDVNSLFLASLVETLNADYADQKLIRGRVIQVRSGPMIDRARNDIVRSFLTHPDKPAWLLMVDADMIFNYNHVRQLLQVANPSDRPVVGGLCFAGNALTIWPTILQFGDGGSLHIIHDYPRDALVKVDATGAAFVLIHRSVLTRMEAAATPQERPAPWFAIAYNENGHFYGEDVVFCTRLRRLQLPVYVHTGVKIGHAKVRPIGEPEYDRFQERVKAVGQQAAEAEVLEELTPVA